MIRLAPCSQHQAPIMFTELEEMLPPQQSSRIFQEHYHLQLLAMGCVLGMIPGPSAAKSATAEEFLTKCMPAKALQTSWYRMTHLMPTMRSKEGQKQSYACTILN